MGLNATARIKAAGVAARKTDVTRVPISVFIVVTEGPTAHPRWHLPIEPSLRDHIAAQGIPGRFTAREAPQRGGRLMFEIIDGARRLKTALEVERHLRKTAPRCAPLVWDRDDPNDPGSLYVDLELWDGDDAALLLARLEANRGGLPDSPSVLAAIVKGLDKIGGVDIGAIVKVMPRGFGPKEVQALGRWGNLVPELRPRFDSGELPIGILGAVLDAPRDEQVQRAEKLKAGGVKSTRGATRRTNAERDKRDPWARRMTPRQAKGMADVLGDLSSTFNDKMRGKSKEERVDLGRHEDAAFFVSCGLRIAANHDVDGTLELLPKPVADAIREARAAKPRKV